MYGFVSLPFNMIEPLPLLMQLLLLLMFPFAVTVNPLSDNVPFKMLKRFCTVILFVITLLFLLLLL